MDKVGEFDLTEENLKRQLTNCANLNREGKIYTIIIPYFAHPDSNHVIMMLLEVAERNPMALLIRRKLLDLGEYIS